MESSPDVSRWMISHALDIAKLQDWKIEASDKIYIPVHSISGGHVFSLYRYFDRSPRYSVHPPGRRRGYVLYGLHRTAPWIRQEHVSIVVEGFSDMLALYYSNVRNVTSILGSQMTEVQAATLAVFGSRAILWLDGDEAGINYAQDVLGRKWPVHVTSVVVEGRDPAEFVASGGRPIDILLRVNQFMQNYSYLKLDENCSVLDARERGQS